MRTALCLLSVLFGIVFATNRHHSKGKSLRASARAGVTQVTTVTTIAGDSSTDKYPIVMIDVDFPEHAGDAITKAICDLKKEGGEYDFKGRLSKDVHKYHVSAFNADSGADEATFKYKAKFVPHPSRTYKYSSTGKLTATSSFDDLLPTWNGRLVIVAHGTGQGFPSVTPDKDLYWPNAVKLVDQFIYPLKKTLEVYKLKDNLKSLDIMVCKGGESVKKIAEGLEGFTGHSVQVRGPNFYLAHDVNSAGANAGNMAVHDSPLGGTKDTNKATIKGGFPSFLSTATFTIKDQVPHKGSTNVGDYFTSYKTSS